MRMSDSEGSIASEKTRRIVSGLSPSVAPAAGSETRSAACAETRSDDSIAETASEAMPTRNRRRNQRRLTNLASRSAAFQGIQARRDERTGREDERGNRHPPRARCRVYRALGPRQCTTKAIGKLRRRWIFRRKLHLGSIDDAVERDNGARGGGVNGLSLQGTGNMKRVRAGTCRNDPCAIPAGPISGGDQRQQHALIAERDLHRQSSGCFGRRLAAAVDDVDVNRVTRAGDRGLRAPPDDQVNGPNGLFVMRGRGCDGGDADQQHAGGGPKSSVRD